jgi:pyridoxal phosphate enzyme (YggS family)
MTATDAAVAPPLDAVEGRLEQVRERIRQAALAAGRPPSEVRLIAVSKLQPPAAIRAAYAAGQRDFGENYAQELVEKARELADLPELRLQLIGNLQRNKARKVAAVSASIASVDSVDLARELARRVAAAARERIERFGADGARLPVLIQVSIAGETQKSGVAPAELGALLAAVEVEPALLLRGLMCVPPLGDLPQASRVYFERLVALRDAHGGASRLPELSMGMTFDLEIAIAAGATQVRVGTAIFGERTAASAPAE